ncbi:MAG: hypothetical protein ACREBU_08885 [Nitrososphaera sp.]
MHLSKKERKRSAQAAFRQFQNKLESKRNLLAKANDAQDWNDLLHDLHSLLKEFGVELPEDVRHHLDGIAEMTDISPENIIEKYTPLNKAVGKAISSLNVGLSTPAIIGIVVAGVAIAGGGTAALILNSFITIDIVNTGCSSMDLSELPPTPLIQHGNQRIDSGESEPLKISNILAPQVDPANKVLEVQGGSFAFPSDADEIRYKGTIMNQKFTLDQDGGLMIICK